MRTAAALKYSRPRREALISGCASPCGRRRYPAKKLMPHKWLRFAAWLFVAVWITACGVGGPFARQKPPAPTEPDRASLDLSPIIPLLQMMGSLPQGDPARWE